MTRFHLSFLIVAATLCMAHSLSAARPARAPKAGAASKPARTPKAAASRPARAAKTPRAPKSAAAPGAVSDCQQGWSYYLIGEYDQAIEALERCVESGRPTAQGLYTLAVIHAAQGRPEEAETVLQQILKDQPASEWTPSAMAMLADMAVTDKSWEQALQLTAKFLDRYLSGPNTTLDDAVCRRMYGRLVDCEKQKSSSASPAAIRGALKKQFPATSPAGRMIEYLTGVDPADPEANLVVNPGFELDGRAIGIPIGWSYRGTEPDVQDDADGVLETGQYREFVKPHDGAFCAGKFTSHGKHRGWFYQRVPVLRGNRYIISAYGLTPAPQSQPGQVRIGADPGGGTDPESNGVKWTQPISPAAEYAKMSLEGDSAVVAAGDHLTVFLDIRQDIPVDANAMLFDDVMVKQAK